LRELWPLLRRAWAHRAGSCFFTRCKRSLMPARKSRLAGPPASS